MLRHAEMKHTVAALFGGQAAPLSRLVYTLLGIAGIIVAFTSSAYRAPTARRL